MTLILRFVNIGMRKRAIGRRVAFGPVALKHDRPGERRFERLLQRAGPFSRNQQVVRAEKGRRCRQIEGPSWVWEPRAGWPAGHPRHTVIGMA